MQILSPSLACCLILLTLPFTQQKVLILMKSSQSIIFFMVCAFCVVLKSHCHIQGQLGFLLYSRSFIILHFTFRCEICTDLIFVRGVSSVSRLIFYFFLACVCPDAKNWLIWKDPDAGKDWTQEEKGMTEDEMVGWHHLLNEHEFE